MGVYHTFYLEGLIEDKWKCLCPKFKGKDGTDYFHSIIDGKSMLHDIFEEFCKKSIVAGEDLPDGEYSRHYLFDEESAQRFIAVRSYENQGYVEKHLVDGFKYDSGRLISDSGIYEWLSPDEFNALDKESRKAYVYFEWTNCGDMLNLLKKIFLVADKFKEMHEYECGFKGATDYRIVVKRG